MAIASAETKKVQAVKPEVLERMMFAKSLLREGENDCQEKNDKFTFARGILALYDAAETALAAISVHLHAQPRSAVSLWDYYNAIQIKAPDKGEIPSKTKIMSLTSIRTSAKHHGVLPEPKNNTEFSIIVRELLRELCERYLDMSLERISLKELIQSDDVRSFITEAEEACEKGDFEDCIIALAHASYHIYGKQMMQSSYETDKRYVYVGDKLSSVTHFHLDLLANGVSLADYHHFKRLIPKIGKDLDTGELFHEWENWFDDEKNWTPENVRFCIDYCIDAAIKFETNVPEEGVYYSSVYIHRIKTTGKSAVIWSAPRKGRDGKVLDRGEIMNLKEGDTLSGWTHSSNRNDEEMMITSYDLPHDGTDRIGFGFVKKVEITFDVIDLEKEKSKQNS